MKLIIDNRENQIKNYFLTKTFDGIEVDFKNLPLGDIFIQSEKESFELFIERKTWKDLHSSIKDGRYREQRSRLIQMRSEHQKVLYILEGVYSEEFEKEYYISLRLLLGYGIPVLYFTTINDTIQFVENIIENQRFENLFQARLPEQDQIEARRQKPKKKYIDSRLFLMETLSQIHGLTFEAVHELCKPFASLQDLFSSSSTFLNELPNITYKTKQGKIKKISKTLVDKIIQNLFHSNS